MRRPVGVVQRILQLPRSDWALLVDALFSLTLARIVIVVLPFREVGRLASRPVRGRESPEQSRASRSRRIRWAVLACSPRVPWRAMCFEQGLAAHLMLRRRGIPSVLYYGAAPDDLKGLSAHVWVRDGDVDVMGCEVASRFAALAIFPPLELGSD